MAVRILNVGLEEDEETGEVIARGVVDQDTIKFIRLDWYQREQGFSSSHVNEIINGFILHNGRVGDITLGMRGQRMQTKGDTYTLLDKVYCIDGGQRLYAAAAALKLRPSIKLHIGAKVHFGTSEEMENDLFCRLGTTQVRISASVLMRNQKKKVRAIEVLTQLNEDERFAMQGRIGWGQIKTRDHLMTGFALSKVIGTLHAHQGGALRSSKVTDLIGALDALHAKIGDESLRNNTIKFFDAIDRCWNIRNLSGGRDEQRPQLGGDFLLSIASVLSRYPDFWEGTAGNERTDFIFLDKFVKRMRGFKIADFVQRRQPKEILFEVIRKRLHLDPLFEEQPAKDAAE